ncbi:PTS ascorbate transporter subunit IIC [Mycoplasma sp. NEAQ87857]|uniref:PTS ascorbate transporter subunit IIC n=1 Tax=Mycoplasma sp. NEAQ87857 TaxID=2683967 RepID=UPI001315EE13|nr:PTS ascorbate transporter subunit IIC [Mycoplasma sp. NEAQ87857]QGZ97800.1 PTS ascorbate transporter subunit IIC [Mycoplasma sp. NEAQ87857]
MSAKKFHINWRALIFVGSVLGLFLISLLATLGVKGFNANGFKFYIDQILIGNFFGINPLLIGLMVLIGYLVLGRSFVDSFLGMIKAMIGVLILSIGAGVLVSTAKPIFLAIASLGTQITPLDPYFALAGGDAWLKSLNLVFYTSAISFILMIGFFINILFVIFRRYTNTHSLMITGHVMLQQSTVITVILVSFFMLQGIDMNATGAQVGVIVLGSIILGTYWSVATSATIKGSDVVTENAGFCVGHQQMLGLAIAYKIGRFFGKKENSSENMKLHPKLKIFEDNIFSQVIILLALFIVLIIIIQAKTGQFVDDKFQVNGKNLIDVASNKDLKIAGAVINFGNWKAARGNAFWLVNVIFTVLKLVGSILVIQMGVRMFVSELQQSFQGIGEKLIPGSVVAVDVAATYGFSPNSVTYGFFSGTLAQYLAFGLVLGISFAIPASASFKLAIGIPLFITLFFNSGSIGVFANASGGYRAAFIVPAILGFFGIIVSSLGLSMMNFLFSSHKTSLDALQLALNSKGDINSPFLSGYIGMFDWNFFYGGAMAISAFNPTVGIIVFSSIPVSLIIFAQLMDSGRQTKATALQNIFKIKPQLITEG